jgi:glutamyl-tRNA synthetase
MLTKSVTVQYRDELVGTPMVLRYIGRLGVQAGKAQLYGADPLAACQVDQWLDLSAQVVPGQGFEAVCSSIDKYLALRTFLAGYSPSVGDFAIWGQLQGEQSNIAQMQAICMLYNARRLRRAAGSQAFRGHV